MHLKNDSFKFWSSTPFFSYFFFFKKQLKEMVHSIVANQIEEVGFFNYIFHPKRTSSLTTRTLFYFLIRFCSGLMVTEAIKQTFAGVERKPLWPGWFQWSSYLCITLLSLMNYLVGNLFEMYHWEKLQILGGGVISESIHFGRGLAEMTLYKHNGNSHSSVPPSTE